MKRVFWWLLAFLITAGLAYYQRITGPTYPLKGSLDVGGKHLVYSLPRSAVSGNDCPVHFPLPEGESHVILHYRPYPGDSAFRQIAFTAHETFLECRLPSQPPAGKLAYYIEVITPDVHVALHDNAPAIIRFRGDVPAWALIPHVVFMFAAMLFSAVTAIYAFNRRNSFKGLSVVTLILLVLGGAIFGPIVQKYAFGKYWAGVPFGFDLTDNKTLIALVFWVFAVIRIRAPHARRWAIVAAVVTLVIFSIPHSLMGSELDRQTGKVTEGSMFLLLLVVKRFRLPVRITGLLQRFNV